jgi:hypothetical protein
MKSCLFWVKKKTCDVDIVIPVFDVMQEKPVRFLIYDNDGFCYKPANDFIPIKEKVIICSEVIE